MESTAYVKVKADSSTPSTLAGNSSGIAQLTFSLHFSLSGGIAMKGFGPFTITVWVGGAGSDEQITKTVTIDNSSNDVTIIKIEIKQIHM